MFHEEKIIDGVLCWRGMPDGEWTQYTAQALTVALTSERANAKYFEDGLAKHLRKLAAVESALSA